MPRIDLTADERTLLVSWLWEPNGYLDYYSITADETAREFLTATPAGDLVQWKRDNLAGGFTFLGTALSDNEVEELASLWWVVYEWDGVNIPPPQMPPEYTTWLVLYGAWKSSIEELRLAVDEATINQGSRDMIDEAGSITATWTMGSYYDIQIGFVDKANNP